jgi:hypothetical protein
VVVIIIRRDKGGIEREYIGKESSSWKDNARMDHKGLGYNGVD